MAFKQRSQARVMGLLEAFGAIEEDHGALTPEEVAWAREAYQRMGCRTLQTGLTHADRLRVMDLGRRCAAAWEDRKKT